MLEDIVLSPQLRYENHTLIYSPADIRLEGVIAAALLSAMLVDTDQGNQRHIALDTPAEKNQWIMQYEREVRRQDWGLLSTEIQLLRDAYVQFVDSPVSLSDICPNIRLLDLAIQLMVYYMRHLVLESVGEHIWDVVPWKAPFAQWLLDAVRQESQRRKLLHIDWTSPADVTYLADLNITSYPPTLFFSSVPAHDIMERYFNWLWTTFRAQASEFPGTKISQSDKNYIITQESNWTYLLPEMNDFRDEDRELWRQWMTDWQDFLTHQLKPEKQILFWTKELTQEQQEQLLDYLKMQERQPMHYHCLTTSIYALRYLGYVRRACSLPDMRRWLTAHLKNDYTSKSAATQFSRAWNSLGRYSPAVKDELILLASHGINPLTH